ncbi:MAG: M20/M25/M40 family metallo-hydrolase [Terriglobales bacterium]
MSTPASLLAWLAERQPEMLACLCDWARMETPSTEPARVQAFARTVAAAFTAAGCSAQEHEAALELRAPGADPAAAPVLVLGHLDTVFATGVLTRMPVRSDGQRLWGPGVYDMKGGVVQLLYALRALAAAGARPRRPLHALLAFDEEIGSTHSRALTEAGAGAAGAALVLEPGAGEEGKLKVARKGIAVYRVVAQGRAAHAGVDFEQGASAIVELAARVAEIAHWSDARRGLSINPGLIAGGTRLNVVAAQAEAHIEARAWTAAELEDFDRRLRSLQPDDERVRLQVEGGLNRPPMEPTPASLALASEARELGRELGLELDSTGTGGGSDGSFAAALGVPTLDGLGMAGGGAHTDQEHILIPALAPRTALLAALLQRI